MIDNRIAGCVTKLAALREGDRAVLELIACGPAAVEPLRRFLFKREPSGLFQARCQAVEALAALGAKPVLVDFLADPRPVSDPVEQTGEDAVTNAVARALNRWPGEEVFTLLLETGRRRPLAGVVEALGSYRRRAAIAVYEHALAEDFCRPEAEQAFRLLGRQACHSLLRLACRPVPSTGPETESSRRCRRSALSLLAELDPGAMPWAILWRLMADGDSRIALTASSLVLNEESRVHRTFAIERIVSLLCDGSADWRFRADAEELLVQQGEACRPIVECHLGDRPPGSPFTLSLQHVLAGLNGGKAAKG